VPRIRPPPPHRRFKPSAPASISSRPSRRNRQRQEAEQKLDEKITTDSLRKETAEKSQFITAEGFTAGYSDNRFIIQSDDGNFKLRPWAHLQFRGVWTDRQGFQGSKANPEDQFDSGFEIRRMKIGADGNLFSPDFTYFFNWATVRSSGNSTVKSSTGATVGTVSNGLGGVPLLEEAWVKYHIPTTPFYVKAGQIHDPLLHEEYIGSRYQQATEFSLTCSYFTNKDAFTEAVTFIYDPQSNIRTEVGVNHGMRSANTNFLSYPDNGSFNQFNYGFAGRVEYKVMGRWKDYNQIGAVGTKEPVLVFGLGADYSERGHAGQLVAAADALYGDQNGLNFYGALLDRYTTHNFGAYTASATGASIVTPDPAVAGQHTNEYAAMFEMGYNFDQHVEPFFRYEYMKLQGTPANSRNYIQAVTGGVNYFFYGHRLKLTAQAIWLPDGTPLDENAGDVLVQSNGKSEVTFVTQLQLLL
jgi:hypothetical protein